MDKYTVTKEFKFEHTVPSRALLVTANGGSITVNAWDGDTWVATDVFSIDTVTEYFTAGLRLQFVPVGGATFSIDLTLGVNNVISAI